jgi:L-amino acid N-acyltransferase YncA
MVSVTAEQNKQFRQEVNNVSKIKIRMANINDAENILSIYAPYIKKTAITFEYEIPDIDEFRQRINKICIGYPYLVCTLDENIVGYAYAYKQRERAAYGWNAETSIYIDENYTGHGIGKSLYSALLEILKLQNIQNVYGGVTYPNISSEKLHKYFNFELIGIHHKTGYKFDCWHDVMWLEKFIGSHDIPQNPFIPINQVDKNQIESILENNRKIIKEF